LAKEHANKPRAVAAVDDAEVRYWRWIQRARGKIPHCERFVAWV